ncbi:sulfatase-like hydrolase/transferase [Flavobacteriaceae bacterium]|nr:sulfatase-like hydrolase/transferase [Flavobacteriaceae bacterium]
MPADELENTTIIFLGDNGSHPKVIQAPFDRNKSKGSLYQGGLHVPLIISGKSVSRINARDQSLINSSDLFATIAEMAGVTLPSYQDSYSFNSLLTSNGQGQRAFNHSEVLNTNPSKSGYTVRSLNYKLIVFDDGEEEFYDLIQDPYESTNLFDEALTDGQQMALLELQAKAREIRQ